MLEQILGRELIPVLAPVAQGADGVVVGSALVEAVHESLDAKGKATPATVTAATELVRTLAEGMRGARTRNP